MYKRGDAWDHKEANEVVRTTRLYLGRGPDAGGSPDAVEVRNFKNLAAYSVFGLGSEDAVAHDDEMKVRDPISKSTGPLYTNGTDPIGAGLVWVELVSSEAVRIAVDGAITPGERANPTDDGKAKKGVCGRLLCVKDSNNGHAWFVLAELGEQVFKIGKPDEDVAIGTTGMISIYRNGSDTGEDILAVLDWMHGGEKVSAGKEVLIQCFRDEDLWRIVNAECET